VISNFILSMELILEQIDAKLCLSLHVCHSPHLFMIQ